VVNNLGWLELYAGNWQEGRRLAEESLAIRRSLGSLREVEWSQVLLGKIAVAMHEVETAAAHFTDSLELQALVGSRWGTALALEGAAGLAVAAQPERALELAGAAAALRVAIGRPVPPVERPMLEGWLAPARQAVSPETAARAWATGEALGESQAVATALELAATFKTR
jgi:hypothetical protein